MGGLAVPPVEPCVSVVGVCATVVRGVGIVVVAGFVDATVVVAGTVVVVVVGGAVVVVGATVVVGAAVVVGATVAVVVVGRLAGDAKATSHAVARRGTVVGAVARDRGFDGLGRVDSRVLIVTRAVGLLEPSRAATMPTVAIATTSIPSAATMTRRRRRCRRRRPPIVVANS